MTKVVLHIDRLVLAGVGWHDGQGVADALQAELGRLLALPGGFDAAAATRAGGDRIDAGVLRLGAGAPPSALGQASAAAIAPRIASTIAGRAGR